MTADFPLYPTPRQTGQQENENRGAGLHLALDWVREGWWELPQLGVPRPPDQGRARSGVVGAVESDRLRSKPLVSSPLTRWL